MIGVIVELVRQQQNEISWKFFVGGFLTAAVGMILLMGVCAVAVEEAFESGSTSSGSTASKSSKVPLFSDASDGMEQFVGGQTIPVGTYDFECDFAGNVSVQLGRSPYTVSLREGDQTRSIGSGDMLTVGWCKIYGPK